MLEIQLNYIKIKKTNFFNIWVLWTVVSVRYESFTEIGSSIAGYKHEVCLF